MEEVELRGDVEREPDDVCTMDVPSLRKETAVVVVDTTLENGVGDALFIETNESTGGTPKDANCYPQQLDDSEVVSNGWEEAVSSVAVVVAAEKTKELQKPSTGEGGCGLDGVGEGKELDEEGD
jgi:hypothetical protein